MVAVVNPLFAVANAPLSLPVLATVDVLVVRPAATVVPAATAILANVDLLASVLPNAVPQPGAVKRASVNQAAIALGEMNARAIRSSIAETRLDVRNT